MEFGLHGAGPSSAQDARASAREGMTELTLCSWPLPTAALGPPSPLPPIQRRPVPAIDVSGLDLPAGIARGMAYGHAENILPYSMQADYTRAPRPQDHPAAVLENQQLRAVFLLDLGGRLWSLFHKPSKTELLAQSPSILFCNLALRNAWFRSGVEWNFGIAGHSPLACSPVHAARWTDPQGDPILRLYAWERLREVVVQIDIGLPGNSSALLVRPRLVNPGRRTAPMYWWSNVAVPLTQGMRVLAPAETALVLGARRELRRRPVAGPPEADLSYPGHWPHAADIFFELQEDAMPWIAAVSRTGRGFFLASQHKLPGRKLWVWGDSTAGRNWQAFLAPGAAEYVEIQAGATRTQLEHFPLAAGKSMSWVEAYGCLAVDPAPAFGAGWQTAWHHVADRIGEVVTLDALDHAESRLAASAESPPEVVLHRGEGWGALERRRREVQGDGPFAPASVVFDDESLSEDQAPWIALLEKGVFSETPPDSPPRGFLIGDAWESLLRSSVSSRQAGPWNAWFHLGIMRRAAGDDAGAELDWRRSLAACWTPWAARCLAVLLREQGRAEQASALWVEACHAAPAQQDLLVECWNALIEAGKPREWRDLLSHLTPAQRSQGRLRLLEAQAAILDGDVACVERFFADRIIPDDFREGETSLADLWSALQDRRQESESATFRRGKVEPAIPAEMDYLMR